MAVNDGVGQLLARHHLLDRIHRQDMRHALIIVERIAGPHEVAGNPAVRIAREVEMQVMRGADLETAEIDARLAPALHRHHHDHAARPLLPRRAAAGAAESRAGHSDSQIDLLAAPHARERAHVLGRNAGLPLLPLGSLGDAVGFAQEIGLPLIETGRAASDVVLVVEALARPRRT